jgi:hypothetical protein
VGGLDLEAQALAGAERGEGDARPGAEAAAAAAGDLDEAGFEEDLPVDGPDVPHSLLEAGRGEDRGDGDEANGRSGWKGAEGSGDVAPVPGERRSNGRRRGGAARDGRAPERDEARKKRAATDDRATDRRRRPGLGSATKETKTEVARSPLAARFQRPPTCQTIGRMRFAAAKATNARNAPSRGLFRVTTSS